MEHERVIAPASEGQTTHRDWRDAFARAAKLFGGMRTLSVACGFHRNAVFRAIRDAKNPPVELAIRASQATGGAVPLREMIPEDLWNIILCEVQRDRARQRKRAAQ